MTLCAGSLGSNAHNDVVAMAKEFGARVHFAHLRNMTREPDGSFFEADHLAGETDMVRLVAALMSEEDRRRAEGRRRRNPDAPRPWAPAWRRLERSVNPGYSFIGRLKGLAELRGVMQTVERFALAASGRSCSLPGHLPTTRLSPAGRTPPRHLGPPDPEDPRTPGSPPPAPCGGCGMPTSCPGLRAARKSTSADTVRTPSGSAISSLAAPIRSRSQAN